MTITTVLPLRDARSFAFVFYLPSSSLFWFSFSMHLFSQHLKRRIMAAMTHQAMAKLEKLAATIVPKMAVYPSPVYELYESSTKTSGPVISISPEAQGSWQKDHLPSVVLHLFQKIKNRRTHWANVVCKVVNREKKFKAVSNLVWVCLKAMI